MSKDDRQSLFTGEGEMRARCRAKNWSATSLGPVDDWPPLLRSTVRTCMESPFPICLWCGPDLSLIYNNGYRRILGAKHPGALGKPGAEVWEETWHKIGPMFERIRAGGPPIYDEDSPFVVERAGAGEGASGASDDPNAWFTFSLSAMRDTDGDIVAYLNVVYETTGRILAERAGAAARARAERAEARLLDVFAHAPAFMAVLRGPEHRFEYVNNTYYQLVGERELVGRPVLEALPEVRDQGFIELLERVVETGEPFVGREMPIRLAWAEDSEEEQRYLDFVYYPITEADGTRSGVVAHGSDVTEHVRARQEAHQARAEAEEANLAKSRFLTSMSHELRTPINAVLGYAELLQTEISGPINDTQSAQLERIRSSTNHLLMLIDDILDLTGLEAGRLQMERRTVDANDTVEDAISLVTPQARQNEIHVTSSCEGDTGPRYTGDPDRVRQILANLLSNAVKFTGPGGRIRVTCGDGSPPDAATRDSGHEPGTYISVSDSGIGIPPDSLEAIFEPFTQLEQEPRPVHGGTGLGLSISRQLAELMGGRITVDSRVGEGSTFTLWLPAG